MKISGFSNPTIKRVIILFLLIAVIGTSWLWIRQDNNKDPGFYLYGNVDIREVQLAFRQPGRIAQMHFDEGDAVTTGTLLASLDAQPYQDALKAAEAKVHLAEAELNKLQRGLRPQEITQAQEQLNQALAAANEAKRNFHRQSQLLTTGASSQRTVDAAKATLDRAIAVANASKAALSQAKEGFRTEDIAAGTARLAAAKAVYDQAATALADTQLFSPSPGTIISRVREPGSMVSSQHTVYGLSLNNPIYVRAYIGETDLGRIAPGTRVYVRSDSSSQSYQGQIGFISPRAEFTPKTVETADLRTDLVYRLRIVIQDHTTTLRQGMPVTIEIPNL